MAEPGSIGDEQRVQHALEIAYRYLAARDRTIAEVRSRLERDGVEPPAAEAAIVELRELGYLDDARFAARFTEDRRRLDRWGDERIARRLTALGVSREHSAAALAGERPDGESELDAALAVLRRRFPEPPRDDRERARALGLLVRRGYDLTLAHDAIRAAESGS